jgi:hypothetical protein
MAALPSGSAVPPTRDGLAATPKSRPCVNEVAEHAQQEFSYSITSPARNSCDRGFLVVGLLRAGEGSSWRSSSRTTSPCASMNSVSSSSPMWSKSPGLPTSFFSVKRFNSRPSSSRARFAALVLPIGRQPKVSASLTAHTAALPLILAVGIVCAGKQCCRHRGQLQ